MPVIEDCDVLGIQALQRSTLNSTHKKRELNFTFGDERFLLPAMVTMVTNRSWIGVWFLAGAMGMATSAEALDWPQWQGPDRDNKSDETGLMQQWPEGGPEMVWKADELGGGYTTPSVADGRVFGMGYERAYEVVWALDEETGETLWKTRNGRANRNIRKEEGPRCTPTVDGDRIYTLSVGGQLVCFNATNGEVIWQRHLKEDFSGNMMSGWGYSESPLIDGNKLICTPGGPEGTLLALNKKTGKRIWQSQEWTDDAAYSSIIVREWNGFRQYIQLTEKHVAGVAAEDGSVLWQVPRDGSSPAVIPTPVAEDHKVYVTSGYGVGCNLFDVSHRGGKFMAEEVYSNKVMDNKHGGVVLVDGYIYGYSDGRGWVCQDFDTGEMVWQERDKLRRGSITYADGRLYLRSEGSKGTVVLAKATPEGYRETGRFQQPDRSDKRSWPHPVVANGKLFLRDQGILLCYDVSKKKELSMR